MKITDDMYPHSIIVTGPNETYSIGPFVNKDSAKRYFDERVIKSIGAKFEFVRINQPYEWPYFQKPEN